MSDVQDALNKILSDPDAMKQVQSLGEQLGLSPSALQKGAPPAPDPGEAELMSAVTRLAPLLRSSKADDKTTALLNALRPFLSDERQLKLDQAQRLIRLLKIIPLIKDSGLF